MKTGVEEGGSENEVQVDVRRRQLKELRVRSRQDKMRKVKVGLKARTRLSLLVRRVVKNAKRKTTSEVLAMWLVGDFTGTCTPQRLHTRFTPKMAIFDLQ